MLTGANHCATEPPTASLAGYVKGLLLMMMMLVMRMMLMTYLPFFPTTFYSSLRLFKSLVKKNYFLMLRAQRMICVCEQVNELRNGCTDRRKTNKQNEMGGSKHLEKLVFKPEERTEKKSVKM